MPPNPKARQDTEHEEMLPKSSEEQDAEKEKMPSKSKEEKDKETKQRQDARVSRLVNKRIPQFLKAVNDYIPKTEKQKARMLQQINDAPNTEDEKDDFKATSVEWQTLLRLNSESCAIQLTIEAFETELRNEWRVKKKESLERREMYSKAKRRELKTRRKRYQEDLRNNFKVVGVIDFPGYRGEEDTSDEENWDIPEEVLEVVQDEAQEQMGTSGEEETGVEEEAEADKETEA